MYVFAGRMDDGWAMLEGVIESATAADPEAEVARAYRMLGSCASVLVEYPRAERFLRRGIEHAELAQLWNGREQHYMTAHLAHVLWATGRWSAAEDLALHTLADGRGGITTRSTPRSTSWGTSNSGGAGSTRPSGISRRPWP